MQPILPRLLLTHHFFFNLEYTRKNFEVFFIEYSPTLPGNDYRAFFCVLPYCQDPIKTRNPKINLREWVENQIKSIKKWKKKKKPVLG